MPIGLDVPDLDLVDVDALFHLAREVLLIVGGQQVDLADLPEVHADGVVDPLGFFAEEVDLLDFFLFFLFLLDEAYFFVVGGILLFLFIVLALIELHGGEAIEDAADHCVRAGWGFGQAIVTHGWRVLRVLWTAQSDSLRIDPR